MGMKWLREDFKCEGVRKWVFSAEVSAPCAYGALQRFRRICARFEEEVPYTMPMCQPTGIPQWAQDEYRTQRAPPQDNEQEPSSDSEEVSKLGPTLRSAESQQANKKRKEAPTEVVRRSKRLRNLAGAEADQHAMQK
jgi:hypothetical protein